MAVQLPLLSSATILDAVSKWAADRPHRRAFAFLGDGEVETASLTFAQLEEKARDVAGSIAAVVAPGARVLLVYPPGLDFVVAFLACLYAGAVAVPTRWDQ